MFCHMIYLETFFKSWTCGIQQIRLRLLWIRLPSKFVLAWPLNSDGFSFYCCWSWSFPHRFFWDAHFSYYGLFGSGFFGFYVVFVAALLSSDVPRAFDFVSLWVFEGSVISLLILVSFGVLFPFGVRLYTCLFFNIFNF